MIDSYMTDKIIIVDVSVDEWGKTTEIESAQIDARVEDYNRLILDKNGMEVLGDMLIMLNSDISLKYNDKIKIKTKCGVVYEQPDKKFQIKKISKIQGFTAIHKEVYV